MTKDEALDLALEALEESVDLVREDYENAKKLYSNYPSRQARLLGLEDGLSKHEAAITAIKQARSAPEEPVAWADMDVRGEDKGLSWTPGNFHTQPLFATPPAQPAPVQDSTCNETLRVQGKAYPLVAVPVGVCFGPVHWSTQATTAAQRQWVGLTDDDLEDIAVVAGKGNLQDLRIVIEAKLRSKNT